MNRAFVLGIKVWFCRILSFGGGLKYSLRLKGIKSNEEIKSFENGYE